MFWKLPGLPKISPNFTRSSPATSPKLLSLWTLKGIQRFHGSFPDFPTSSLELPGSNQTSQEVNPSSLWEERHPLMTQKRASDLEGVL